MRTKNKVTKLMPGETRERQEALARFGDTFTKNPDACRLAERWSFLCRFMEKHGVSIRAERINIKVELRAAKGVWRAEKKFKRELARQVGLLIDLLRQALKDGSGELLEDLAAAVERIKNPVDRARLYFLRRETTLSHLKHIKFPVQLMTVSELSEEVSRLAPKPVSERQIRRMAKELDLRIAKGQRGPKKGKR